MKYKSPIITTATGSIGGLNASNNKGGQYFRSKPNPRNSTSPNRSGTRSSLGALSNAWKNLSHGQRLAWSLYGQNVLIERPPVVNRHINGYHHFIRSNMARFPIFRPDPTTDTPSAEEYAIIADAPTVFSLPGQLVPLQVGIFLQPHAGVPNTIFFGIQADVLDPPFDPPRGNWITFYVGKPYNVGKSSYHQGLTYQGFTVYPELGETPFQHLFPTSIQWQVNEPMRIVCELTVTLLDGRCTNPQRLFAEYP